MPRIDPSSRVAGGAKLADDVEVGPFCTIGPSVELGAGVRLLSHVNLTGVTTIGERTVIYPFASLGTPPQSTGYRGGATRLTVGAGCQIREGVTVSTGTEDGGEVTTVGDPAVLQFCRVGEGAMLGGVSGITRDIIPFGFAFGPKADLVGLNVVGLKRRQFTRGDIHRIRSAYQALFFGDGTFTQRFERVSAEYASDPVIGKIVSFIREGGKHPLMMPAAGSGLSDPNQ